MRNVFVKFFDILFPPSLDACLVRTLTQEDMKKNYSLHRINDVVTLSHFQNPAIRALIHEAKFHGSMRAYSLLSMFLDIYLHENIQKYDAVIPIPLSAVRMRERGYNQVYEVIVQNKYARDIGIEHKILTRIRHTQPQTSLDKEQRQKNLIDAFSVALPETITGKHILLIDDVVTTGTTLRTAKAELLRYSPKAITCLALAH